MRPLLIAHSFCVPPVKVCPLLSPRAFMKTELGLEEVHSKNGGDLVQVSRVSMPFGLKLQQ